MKKYILAIFSLLAVNSCTVPVSFGVDANGIRTSYSTKGGLVIDIDPTVFVESAK